MKLFNWLGGLALILVVMAGVKLVTRAVRHVAEHGVQPPGLAPHPNRTGYEPDRRQSSPALPAEGTQLTDSPLDWEKYLTNPTLGLGGATPRDTLLRRD